MNYDHAYEVLYKILPIRVRLPCELLDPKIDQFLYFYINFKKNSVPFTTYNTLQL